MKKTLWICVLTIMMCGVFVSVSFAQQATIPPTSQARQAFLDRIAAVKETPFEGTISHHDPLCHCLIVKTAKGELLLQEDYSTFMEGYDPEKGLKAGAKIRGTYKRVDSFNYATGLEYLK